CLLAARDYAISRLRETLRFRAVCLVSHRARFSAACGRRRGMDARVIPWLRRRFVAGFFVMVPLVVSLLALVWIFRVIDGLTAPLYRNMFGPSVPPAGLGILT